MDRKTVRKQNRVLFDAIETYGLINQHAVLVNSPNLVVNKSKHDVSVKEFRFDVVQIFRLLGPTKLFLRPFKDHRNFQQLHGLSICKQTWGKLFPQVHFYLGEAI